MEFETNGVIETHDGNDWYVTILWEYEGGIQINGVYDEDGSNGEYDHYEDLSKPQKSQVEMICIEAYADMCDAAEGAAEDYADWLYEDRKDRRLGV